MSTKPNFENTQEPLIQSELRRTRNGTTFDPSMDYLWFSTNGGQKNFDFARLGSLCGPDLALGVRKTISWYLENRSVPHAYNLYGRLLHFLVGMQSGSGVTINSITEYLLHNYREMLDDSTDWYLGSLRGFFIKFVALGYSGVTQNAATLLEEITIKGNKKGWAVLTMDETEGPFTDMEFRLIQGEVNEALGKGRMDFRICALVWLYMHLGVRSAQVADLKLQDIEKHTDEDGAISYILRVPRVKQRNQERRGEFKERDLPKQVGMILEAWCSHVESDFGGKIADARNLPMFPCSRISAIADPGFEFHTDTTLLHYEVSQFFQEHSIDSPRTGEVMKITPRRFRYTLGTRAVIHGAGAGVIAELLDHSDTQNVMVYTKLSDELIEELNAELADDLEPLAQAFRGEIVLFDKGFLSDPSRLIAYPGLDLKKNAYTGKCKCGGECGDVPPIFCYNCPHFTAFKGAPHSEVLDLMHAEKAKELELGNKVVAKQIDEAIAACRAVIRKCQEVS